MPPWLVPVSARQIPNPKLQIPTHSQLPTLGVGLWVCLGIWSLVFGISPSAQSQARRVKWDDVGAFHARLQSSGLAPLTFNAYVERTHSENLRRVREGDLDHLVYYLLQST